MAVCLVRAQHFGSTQRIIDTMSYHLPTHYYRLLELPEAGVMRAIFVSNIHVTVVV